MKDMGYEFINVDGGWWAGSDTGKIGRNSSGFFEYNQQKFPHGMKALIDYIHSKGLKYGHYTDSGLKACNKDAPMSQGYEHQDAKLFALEYGADMVRVDACAATLPAQELMTRWRDVLNKTGRPVLFSNCHNGCETPSGGKNNSGWKPWCAELSNMWRSSRDIKANWKSVMDNLDTLRGRGGYGAPGRWNDPDFLEVDNGEFACSKGGCTPELLAMNRAHFTMWCITSAPLIAGNDMRSMSNDIRGIFTNADAVGINQAYAGNAGDLLENFSPQPLDGLPARPMVVTSMCTADAKDQDWDMRADGHICSARASNNTSGVCFNNQDCQGPIIQYEFSSSGCGGGKNELYKLAAGGRLHGLIHPDQCIEPKETHYNQLFDTPGPCNSSLAWSYDVTTKQLIMTVNQGQDQGMDASPSKARLCATRVPAPPGPAPGPTPAPGAVDVWYKPLPNGEAAIAVLNANDNVPSGATSIHLASLPTVMESLVASKRELVWDVSCTMLNVWEKTTTTVTGSIAVESLAPQSVFFVKLSNCK
jgi:hypothetical protein